MSSKFYKVADGKYAVDIINVVSGAERRILVKKVQVSNPSARGGAYKDGWVAYNGGMYVKVSAESRQGAFDAAMRSLADRNLLYVEVAK